jgi:formylglycine-generating enzyme required for sulfatase activity
LFAGVACALLGAAAGNAQQFEFRRSDGGGELMRDAQVWMRFRATPADTFTVGTHIPFAEGARRLGLPPDLAPDSSTQRRLVPPAQRLRAPRATLLGVHELTHQQFSDFVDATGYTTDAERMGWAMEWTGTQFRRRAGRSWRAPGYAIGPAKPVTMVTWPDAMAFVAWLSAASGRTVRLPSEWEWEHAARAGGAGMFGAVDDTSGLGEIAWYGHAADSANWRPLEVGSRRANAWGFHDMLGNVWEWTADAWEGSGVPGAASPDGAPVQRVLRGGSWLNQAPSLLPFSRAPDSPTLAEPHIGFRVVIE